MQNKPIMKIFKKILTVSLSLLSIQLAAQDTINGTVTDENGSPLPGATILVVGTDEGVTSGFDGNFSIEALEGSTLSIQFVVYSSQEIPVATDNDYTISLQPDSLQEVVVTALGISERKNHLDMLLAKYPVEM